MRPPSFVSIQKFVAARFSPEEELGLHLTAGVVVMVLAAMLFGDLADDVMEADNIVHIDHVVANWFHGVAKSWLTPIMLAITHLHSLIGIGVLSMLLGLYFHVKKAPYWLLTLAVAVPGGMLLNVLLKYVYMRARPVLESPILTLDTYSFPSGHTAAATLFYGIVAAYLVCLTPRWRRRAAIALGACAMVALVGVSRMYLGVHFLSDVMAAMLESAGWLAVVIAASATLRRRRAARPEQ